MAAIHIAEADGFLFRLPFFIGVFMIQKLNPSINVDTLKDGRGGILTYLPKDEKIAEWNVIVTHKEAVRGHHYHKEFDEYITMVQGAAIYSYLDADKNEHTITVGTGDCIFIPKLIPHTMYPLEDCKMVALLTKKWDDCEEPITRV